MFWKIGYDTIICYAAALGIPKLLFWILTTTSPYKGGAAMTSSLKNISFRVGMEEGIGVFVLIGLISYRITAYWFKKYYENRLEMEIKAERIMSNDTIVQYVMDKYAISKQLKIQLLAKFVLPI